MTAQAHTPSLTTEKRPLGKLALRAQGFPDAVAVVRTDWADADQIRQSRALATLFRESPSLLKAAKDMITFYGQPEHAHTIGQKAANIALRAAIAKASGEAGQ